MQFPPSEQTHTDLDNLILWLSGRAPIPFPTADEIPSVQDRHAAVLSHITCFVQTVITVSFENGSTAQKVYADKQLMDKVVGRVMAVLQQTTGR